MHSVMDHFILRICQHMWNIHSVMDHLFSRKATIIWTDFGQVNYKVLAASEYQDFHASM